MFAQHQYKHKSIITWTFCVLSITDLIHFPFLSTLYVFSTISLDFMVSHQQLLFCPRIPFECSFRLLFLLIIGTISSPQVQSLLSPTGIFCNRDYWMGISILLSPTPNPMSPPTHLLLSTGSFKAYFQTLYHPCLFLVASIMGVQTVRSHCA